MRILVLKCTRVLQRMYTREVMRQQLRQLASRLTCVAASTTVLVFPVPAAHKHTHT